MEKPERGLRPANQNPWYILMTLYGEQEGEFRLDVHEKNRAAWNAWACQGMGSAAKEKIATKVGVDPVELQGGLKREVEISGRHKRVWKERNGGDLPYPGMPSVEDGIDLREIKFSKPIMLDQMVFRQGVYFVGAQFLGAVSFGGAQFDVWAVFDGAYFGASAGFFRARFSDRATFVDAHFEDDALFGAAQFGGFTLFQGTVFGREGSDKAAADVEFMECQFEKPLSFRGAKFRETYPDFDGAELPEKVVFTAEEDHWPVRPQTGPKQARASCAVIRHALGRQGLPEKEHFFFRREMRFTGQIGGWWKRLPFRVFGWLSDYGHSIWRPVAWLCALWLGPMLIYMFYFNWPGAMARMNGIEQVAVGPYDSVTLSFTSMFKFLGLQRVHFGADYIQALPPFLEFLTAFQTLGGIVLLFFLGLGLRTRFRLR